VIFDAVILGAGASGLMCALQAAKRGKKVLLIDHRKDFAKKLIVSGGGRCNFTNALVDHRFYHSTNPHFVKSALAGYQPADFIAELRKQRIEFVKEEDGKHFLKGASRLVVDMFTHELKRLGVDIAIGKVKSIEKREQFNLQIDKGKISARKLVIATGGLSYPDLGATDLGYKIARKFGHEIVPQRPALVPLLFSEKDKSRLGSLSGLSFSCRIKIGNASIEDDCLITHKGLSGPAILKASLYWREKNSIVMDLLPDRDVVSLLKKARSSHSRVQLKNVFSKYMPGRLAELLCGDDLKSKQANDLSNGAINDVHNRIKNFEIRPIATAGYEKAEVTLGGVSTDELSSKTMESRKTPGLYFIGEVLDVTGDLGGYNLHWAWASGHAAGHAV